MSARIEIPYDEIAEFCWRVRKLSLFGSVIRDDFTPRGDVDVLVEFQPGPTPGLKFFWDMPNHLSDILGHYLSATGLSTPTTI
ncbi:MAG: nucleotidyltransferase domain-containing protein [Dehalococcoidia bacterium]|nr:nucleotidyltransferase domain-containing protein [Dehalococcoidia bacterium]